MGVGLWLGAWVGGAYTGLDTGYTGTAKHRLTQLLKLHIHLFQKHEAEKHFIFRDKDNLKVGTLFVAN